MNLHRTALFLALGVLAIACSAPPPDTAVPVEHEGLRISGMHLVSEFYPPYGGVIAPLIFADLGLKQGEPFDSALVRDGIQRIFEREKVRVVSVRTFPAAQGRVSVTVHIASAA